MGNKNKRIVLWSLVLLWMAFIFFMSSQRGEISSKQSSFMLTLLDMLGIDLNSHFGELSTYVIRKGAHFTEYMILYLLTFNLLRLYKDKKRAYIYSIFIVFGYACSDEFHQLFVEGRSGQFKDVLIDTSGGIFGSLLVMLKSKFSI